MERAGISSIISTLVGYRMTDERAKVKIEAVKAQMRELAAQATDEEEKGWLLAFADSEEWACITLKPVAGNHRKKNKLAVEKYPA